MQKKWYIYVVDHHEGPFSFEDIKAKLAKNEITLNTFIWTDGLSDWMPIKDVPDFKDGEKQEAEVSVVVETPKVEARVEAKEKEEIKAEEKISNPEQVNHVEEAAPTATDHEHEEVRYLEQEDEAGVNISKGKEPKVEKTSTKINKDIQEKEPTVSGIKSYDNVDLSFDVTEQIWALKANGLYSGPYSAAKIVAMLDKNEIKEIDFLWRESWSKWTKISEIQKIISLTDKANKKEESKKVEEKTTETASPTFIGAQEDADFPRDEEIKRNIKKRKLKVVIAASLVVILLGGVAASLFVFPDKLSNLGIPIPKYFIKLTNIEGVSAEEMNALRTQAKVKVEDGPTVVVVQKNKDDIIPAFIAATNMPDGTQFEVELTGVAGTLLNLLSYHNAIKVDARENLINIPQFSYDGKPLPKGEYIIKISLSKMQPQDIQVIAGGAIAQDQKRVFVGGKKDDVYRKRLAEYLASVDKQFQNEINEAKEIASNIELLLNDANDSFNQVQKAKKKEKAAKWTVSVQKWQGFYTAIDERIRKFTPDVVRVMMFPDLFGPSLQEMVTSLLSVRAAQALLIEEKSKDDLNKITMGKSYEEFYKSVQEQISSYKMKIDNTAQNPPVPSPEHGALMPPQPKEQAPEIQKSLPTNTVKETTPINNGESK